MNFREKSPNHWPILKCFFFLLSSFWSNVHGYHNALDLSYTLWDGLRDLYISYSPKQKQNSLLTLNLHPDISMHILHTVLYTFPKVLTRRICLTIKSFISWWSFPLFSWHFDLMLVLWGEIRSSPSKRPRD